MLLPAQKLRLQQWARSPQSEAPLLLTATHEATLQSTAEYVAQSVVCLNTASIPCLTCVACKQVLTQIHPDVFMIGQDASTISIKQIRGLLHRLTRRSLHGKQILVIHQAQHLSLPASNALLKSLEEPSPTARLVLTTSFPRTILATILSRCQRLRIVESSKTVDIPTTLAALKQVPAFSEEDLTTISHFLQEQLRRQGPTPTLKRAFYRLRDYYKITAAHGNEKLAREVLVASLP